MSNFIGDVCAGPDLGKLSKWLEWLQFKHPVMYKKTL